MIPGIQCDGASDDDAVEDDDDDSVPDDYWKCLKDYSTSDECSGAGCVWCVSDYL